MAYRDLAQTSMTEADAVQLVSSLDAPGFTNLRRAIEQRVDEERRAFDLMDEEKDMLRGGNRIGAITSVRHRLKIDLRMAKDMVDRLWPLVR